MWLWSRRVDYSFTLLHFFAYVVILIICICDFVDIVYTHTKLISYCHVPEVFVGCKGQNHICYVIVVMIFIV